MPQNYHIADFSAHMPVRCHKCSFGTIERHLHDYFELVILLRGSCVAYVGDEQFTLNTEDVLAINPYTTHGYLGHDCSMIAVQFSPTLFEQTLPHPVHPEFNCNSARQENSTAFDHLRRLVARLVKNNADTHTGYELRNWAIVYELMDEMYNNFRVTDSTAHYARAHRYAARMSEITSLVAAHYTEPFTLSQLAEEVHLSAPYLSKFFDRQFGMTFLNYLTHVRLNHAVKQLLQTEATIETISSDSGFPNSHAFVQAFKKEYGVLPSVYRRQKRAVSTPSAALQAEPEQHDDLAVLRKYLKAPITETVQTDTISINVKTENHPYQNLRHTWRNVISVSSAADLLQGNVQTMLRRIQREIGFRYIKFNGLFSDELHIFSHSRDGNAVYSFAYIDQLFDFLLEIGLKPFVQLSFMPQALAKDPQRRLLNFIVSEPRDSAEWAALVAAVIRHLLARYDAEEVHRWKFSVWSQPDTPVDLYGFSSDEAFYEFYRITRQAVKQCDPALCFGAPAMYYVLQKDYTNWYIPFLQWCRVHGCEPDFLNFHYYDTVLDSGSETGQESFGFLHSMRLRESPDGFNDFVTQVISEVHEHCTDEIPIYLTAWNNTPSQQDYLNDTCFKSCYIARSILENYDKLESFGYWALTDFMGEAPLPEETFFGGLGLFTKEGLPKASYYAFTLLRRLGGELLSRGPGWFITREGDRWQILLYNYRHFSHLYAQGDRFDMTFTDRYTPFSPEQMLDAHITLTDMPEGKYLVTTETLNRASGSAFDLWCSMGAVDPATPQDLAYLDQRARPSLQKHITTAKQGVLELDMLLDMLEVKLIVLEKQR